MKYIYTPENFWQIILIIYFGISAGGLIMFALPKTGNDFLKAVKSRKGVFVLLLLISSTFGFFGHIFYDRAILLGPVSLVSSFIGFQSFFVLMFATFLSIKFPMFIREAVDFKTIGTKLIAIGMMAFGLYLLGL